MGSRHSHGSAGLVLQEIHTGVASHQHWEVDIAQIRIPREKKTSSKDCLISLRFLWHPELATVCCCYGFIRGFL